METIGFIGIGNLGYPIAENLLKAGYKVKIYNRTRVKALPLEAQGAVLVNSPEEAAEKGGIVLTLVSDDAAITSIAGDAFAAALGNGGIHVSLSTISPDTARVLAAHHKEYGVHYVGAPIFARPEAAAAKVGNAVISGNAAAKERIKPLLEAGFAKRVFDLGEDEGNANVLKLIGNFMIAGAIEMMAEGFALAEKNGLEVKAVYEMLTSTLFASPVFSGYGAMIVDRKYNVPSFSAALGLKDMNLVLQTASRSHTPMPLANLVQSRLTTVVAKNEIPEADWVALASGAFKDAGI